MGTSTNAEISYGILLGDEDDDFELPWDAEDSEFDGDVEDWWRYYCGYTNPHEYPWDDRGQYKPGFREDDPRISDYFQHRREWMEANPVPFEMVNACHIDYPTYIIAVPSSVKTVYRGSPKAFNPADLVPNADDLRRFLEMVKVLKIEGEPQWWLSSYWG